MLHWRKPRLARSRVGELGSWGVGELGSWGAGELGAGELGAGELGEDCSVENSIWTRFEKVS